MKGVQCHKLFGGIVLKNHAFLFIHIFKKKDLTKNQYGQGMHICTVNEVKFSVIVSCSKHAYLQTRSK